MLEVALVTGFPRQRVSTWGPAWAKGPSPLIERASYLFIPPPETRNTRILPLPMTESVTKAPHATPSSEYYS